MADLGIGMGTSDFAALVDRNILTQGLRNSLDRQASLKIRPEVMVQADRAERERESVDRFSNQYQMDQRSIDLRMSPLNQIQRAKRENLHNWINHN